VGGESVKLIKSEGYRGKKYSLDKVFETGIICT